ncbi:interferon lambda-3-like [Melanerpes formicivorus]|uniref:interferon lambda-3-like n=1 Tax=Melanerpes formicivorus TaxID=211600 RepID=UPI00358F3E07
MLCLNFILLIVLLLGASLGDAFPSDALKKTCSLSKYQSPVPHELEAVQKMKQEFEDDLLLLSDRRCHTNLFHRKKTLVAAELSVPDRLMLVETELDFAVTMLELPAPTRFTGTRQRPLAFLTQARQDLRDCMATEAPSHQPSRKLRHQLQKLETARKTETTGCLEASAILHIFHILKDLQCAALRDQCT